MNVPIKSKNEVLNPPAGYVFAFIDREDMQLKAKLSDGIVINYTNVNEDMKVISLFDYSAFEVFPNKDVIVAGTVDAKTGLTYEKQVESCVVHKMTIRSSVPIVDNDVVIDWGDGCVEAIKDGKYEWKSNKQYNVEHNYSSSIKEQNQRFIVKIYGKDYYTFRHNESKNNNLISRIFDTDLPIASHVENFASLAIYSKRLLKVHFPHSTSPYSRVWNWSSTFQECQNLKSVTGFEDLVLRADSYFTSFMANCGELIETDFVIPAGSGEIGGIFNGCENLAKDINDIIPTYGFTSSNIYLKNTFKNTKITGIIPSEKLWENKKINWMLPIRNTSINDKNQSLPFTGCPNEIRSQAPVSWGGTNSSIDAKLSIKDENYFTAFEVYPNKDIITAGTSDEKTGLNYSVDIPICTTHKMVLRSSVPAVNNDVVIDWGDGCIEAIKDGKYEWKSEKQYDLVHDYVNSIKESNQRFIVKIYGKDYYTFRYNDYVDNNLTSRIFDVDLPLANHVENLASSVCFAHRLLKVHFPHSAAPYSSVWNWSHCFKGCNNLISVTGFEDMNIRDGAIVSGILQENKNLTTTDFVLPSGTNFLDNIIRFCPNLKIDISKMIPAEGFKSCNIKIRAIFSGNSNLTGTVPAEKLWNDHKINWKVQTSTIYGKAWLPFMGCSDEIRAQVPLSWGGTAPDTIIEERVEERIEKIEDVLKENNFLAL